MAGAFATKTILDAAGAPVVMRVWDESGGGTGPFSFVSFLSPASQNQNGSYADAASAPVAFSTEGKAQLGSLTESAPTTDTSSSGLNGRLQRLAQRISSLIALLPTALGGNVAANSLAVVPADQYGTHKEAPASATTLLGATGAVGDYLAGVVIVPGSATCGTVGMTDGNGATIPLFAGGGTTALPSLVPFCLPLGIFAVNATTAGWRLILGANVTAIGIGKFT